MLPIFDDLCTVNEIQSLSQRLQVAKMIKQGYTYATIEQESGASTATISRGSVHYNGVMMLIQ